MSLTPSDWQRLEVIRRLEQSDQPLTAAPQQATQLAAQGQADLITKLNRRAGLLDSDQHIQQALQRVDTHARLVWLGLTLLAALLGFGLMTALMQDRQINFFGLWVTLLTANAVSLLIWLFLYFRRNRAELQLSQLLPARLLKAWQGADPTNRAVFTVYQQLLTQGYLKTDWSQRWHQVWLAGLLGIGAGLLLMLLTRQYVFVWESTLLDTATLLDITHFLGWLPQHLGFGMPSDQAITQARQVIRPAGLAQDSRSWAGLLAGSLLCYAVLPRLLAWLWTAIQAYQQQKQLQPDLSDPYYRQLATLLQPPVAQVIDADDLKPDTYQTVSARRQGAVVVALLSLPEWSTQSSWYETFGLEPAEDLHVIDSREERDQAISQLRQLAPCQLYLGVRLSSVPDRGSLRQIEQLYQAAGGGGEALGLLLPPDAETRRLRLQQWTQALAELGITLRVASSS